MNKVGTCRRSRVVGLSSNGAVQLGYVCCFGGLSGVTIHQKCPYLSICLEENGLDSKGQVVNEEKYTR